jgi:Zinc carboxypeptidase
MLFFRPFFCLFFIFCGTIAFSQNKLRSPDEFLPHQYGAQFTPHHLVADYFRHVAANSDMVQLTEYGRTNQGRPLLLAVVTSKENMGKLEQIRQNNLRRAGLLSGTVDNTAPISIVWLSHSVHGNEPAGTESSMKTLYELVNPNNTTTKEWLKTAVVIIDPSLNPDGFDRYVSWYRNVSNKIPNTTSESYEHKEPWPSGRVNHYQFDLNRDWAWLVQTESQQRLKAYRAWMPHVHADIHEMGATEPYYFAPAAAPYYEQITQWQRDFQMEIGKNHAKYFDTNNWLYFTREVFDLFYPSYGDTYPTYNGSVGMTYEQGGIGAGRALKLANADTLTLKKRITHHHTTALSTVETSAKNAQKVTEKFTDYFQKSQNNPSGAYKSFIVKGNNNPDKLKSFLNLLEQHNIQYGYAEQSTTKPNAYNYNLGKTVTANITNKDIVISAYQPMSVLAQSLLEPNPRLEDSLTYDITAWSLPYAYGLESYALTEKLTVKPLTTPYDYKYTVAPVQKPYSYIGNWASLNNAQFLGALMQKGVNVRTATQPFSIENIDYTHGTLIITRADNGHLGDKFDAIVLQCQAQYNQQLTPVRTGFATKGADLGSEKMKLLKKPNILVLAGEDVGQLEFGQAWHYFEQQLNFPVTVLGTKYLNKVDLSKYDLMILPDGDYSLEDMNEKLINWTKNGGRMIAFGDALLSLAGQKGFALKRNEENKDEKPTNESLKDPHRHPHGDEERNNISNLIPGAIFQVKLDKTHPLAYGMEANYYSLKTSTIVFGLQKELTNVGYIDSKPNIFGFAGAKIKPKMKNSLVFGVQDQGKGKIIYMVDNPLYRGFWRNGLFLFSNAVFMVQ